MFGDIYHWAGETRTVDISKDPVPFCHWRYVDDKVSALLGELADEGRLVGLV